MDCLNDKKPSEPRDPRKMNDPVQGCGLQNFLIIYGDPGLEDHNQGRQFELAAKTHERELRANQFPGAPHFAPGNALLCAHASSVTTARAYMTLSNLVYWAYFGHSWNGDSGGSGGLGIGEKAVPDSNLTDVPGPNNTPCSVLVPPLFLLNAQVRIFGCRGGYSTGSIAEQIARQLHVVVYGYSNSGGSLFTGDRKLGHGQRAVNPSDIGSRVRRSSKDLWLIPINGTPTFRQFSSPSFHR